MEQIQIDAQPREETGKAIAKKLRAEGRIPAIVYNKGKNSTALSISNIELIHALHTSAGENVIINLNIKQDKKEEKKTVIIKDIQYHPIKGEVIHVDFGQISLTEKVTVKVPVEIKGEAIGVKRDEGTLEHILWEAEIECLPTKIPEKIEVHVDDLEIGDIIHVKDLEVEEEIKILNNPDDAVVVIEPPRKVEEEGVPEAEEAVEEEKEPEVIGEKEREEREREKEEEKRKKEGEEQQKKLPKEPEREGKKQ
jgi:large subunit ribosomal protein L25